MIPNPQSTILNDWANFWHYEIGVNPIPADTKNKTTYESWTQWQDQSMPDEVHELRKSKGDYNSGIAIMPGKIWRGPFAGKCLVAIDLDNRKAIQEFCKDENGLQELKQQTLVEQTSNPDKMHIYFIVEREIPNKTSDKVDSFKSDKIKANEIPALEVKSKSKGIMFVANSPHQKDGYYQIKGTLNPQVFKAQDLEDRIGGICDKYGIPYGFNDNNNSGYYQTPIEDLFKPETKILEGHNRHKELLRVMDSLLARNREILSPDKIKELAYEWNREHCVPPLDDKEFEKEWKQSAIFIAKGINSSSSTTSINHYNGNGYHNNKNSQIELQYQINFNLPEAVIKNKNYFEFVIKSIQKTVKCEDALIRQILYTGFSTYVEDEPHKPRSFSTYF